MRRFHAIGYVPWLALVLSFSAPHAHGAANGDMDQMKAELAALGELTTAPRWEPDPGAQKTAGPQAIYFDGLPWKGQPTKVFAWIGMPAKGEGQVPGVVLVHGGGGTAFKEWVEKWNALGFAAVSIAVEGQTDRKIDNPPAGAMQWVQHEQPGPLRNGIYGDSAVSFRDQWMYHAAADSILAHSLLRSWPGVDPGKIGLMGVSWGGVIASTVAGLDPRLAFVIPVYGCGHLADGGGLYQRALGNLALYKEVWDPFLRLGQTSMPVLWMSWPGDKHFSLVSLDKCKSAAKGPQMLSLVPGMGHGHQPAWNRPDSYAFAESVVKIGQPWLRAQPPAADGSRRKVAIESAKPLDRAVLISTAGTGFTGDREWSETPASLTGGSGKYEVSADLPPGSTAWFFNLLSGDLVASVGFESAPEPERQQQ